MGLFSKQFADVVEWDEFRDDSIFWKWTNKEIKKGSKLVIRPGQDAIFLAGGRIEGIFQEDGDYDIESQIIPFLSTLKGFQFGFKSGMRAEVLFVNTKEFQVKWGTKNAVNIPCSSLPGGAQALPGGLPIRANGTFTFRVTDYVSLVEQVAGVKQNFLVEDIRLRISAVLDQLLMKWITNVGSKNGGDIFHLQVNAFEIAKGIQEDLNTDINSIGITITGFQITSFNYPDEIQDMINKNASYSMVGDLDRYQQISVVDGISSGKVKGGSTAADMTGMMMGMKMAGKMMQQMDKAVQESPSSTAQTNSGQESESSTGPNFCPNCGAKVSGAKFCPNCGQKLIV